VERELDRTFGAGGDGTCEAGREWSNAFTWLQAQLRGNSKAGHSVLQTPLFKLQREALSAAAATAAAGVAYLYLTHN